MHDNWLIAIAFATSGAGLIIMLFALLLIPESFTITQAHDAAENTPLAINGTLIRTRTLGERTILTVQRPETIDVVVEQNITLPEGTCITASGKRTSYNGKTQVSATRITLC